MIVNQKTLAQCIGVTPRRVRELREEGFFPTVEGGKGYCLEKCVLEYINYKTKDESKAGASLVKEEVQAQHEVVKKEISKLKLRKLRGELHEAVDVEMFLTEMLIKFKNKLLSVPPKIAMQVIGETDITKAIELLNQEMLDALTELSNYDIKKISKVSDNEDLGEDEPDNEERDE